MCVCVCVPTRGVQVYMVVGRDNMWANVHAGGIREPWHVDFSWGLDDPRKWAPVYTSVHARPPSLPDEQPAPLYTQPAPQFTATVSVVACVCVRNCLVM